MFKRIMSLILCIVMLVTALPLEAMAQQGDSTAKLDPGTTEIRGTNTFGTMVAEEIKAEYEEDTNTEGGYGILDLEITGNTAKVNYFALEEANLVVAIYTEDGVQMLTSGNTRIDPEKTVATVTIAGTMPEYFLVGAYMLDTYDFSPLCSQFTTALYTKEIQELVHSTVEDYAPELVLNLDDDDTTNFAVYAEDTVIVEAQEDVNVITKVDNTNKVYVIENADEQFLYLQKGDVVSYPYGEEDLLIFKVDSVSISGTTVTVRGGDLEMEDVFSHVKIEGTGDMDNATVDTSVDGDVEFLGYGSSEASGSSPAAWDGEAGIKKTLKFKLKKLWCDKFHIDEGSISLTAGISLKFYIASKTQSITLSKYFDTGFTIKVEAKIKTDPVSLLPIKIPICAGVMVDATPELHFEFGGELEVKFTHRMYLSVSYTNGGGLSVDSGSEIIDSGIEISAVIAVVVEMSPALEVLHGVIELSLVLEGKIELKGTLFKAELADRIPVSESGKKLWKHSCKYCVDFELCFEIKVGVAVEMLFRAIAVEATETFTLPKLYFHASEGKFGSGQCKKNAYLTTFNIFDPYGRGKERVKVSCPGMESATSNKEGIAEIYLNAGERTVKVDFQGKESYSKTITVESNQTYKVKQGEGFAKSGLAAVIQQLTNAALNLLKKLVEFADKVMKEIEQAQSDQKGSGVVTDAISYVMYKDGKLEVFGEGYISKFDNPYKGEVTELVIGDGITDIGWNAFEGYSKLEKVTLPDSVTRINPYAFNQCTSLTNIKFPNTITYIGHNAFNGCTSLTSIRLPEGLDVIDNHVFYGCTKLSSVYIPESVEEIWGGTFTGTAISSIKLPSNLKSLGSAFSGCTKLTELVIPDSCTELGHRALNDCTSLKRLVIGSGVEELYEYLCEGCTRLEEVEIRGGKTIRACAFEGCARLKTVKLADSIETIGDQAFFGCDISTLKLPKQLKTIGYMAFSLNTSLTQVEMPAVETIGAYAFDGSALTAVHLPEGLETVGYGAFQNCTALQEASLPSTLKEIPGSMFHDCTALSKVVIAEGPTAIGNHAFFGCALPSLEIPNSVTTIGMSVFLGNTQLKTVTLPENLTSIGTYAFNECAQLERLEIPAGVDVIPNQLCDGCTSLKEVIIHGGKTIEQFAFMNCPQLETVILGDSITEIGYGAFEYNDLKILQLPKNLKTIGGHAFYDNVHLAYVELPEGLTTIESYAFSGCSSLDINGIPSTVTSIGAAAFDGCRNITAPIHLPEGITVVEAYTFQNCAKVPEIRLPSTLQEIGDQALAYMYGLTDLVLPEGLKKIGGGALSGCDTVTDLKLPDSVTTIDGYAFYDWQNLKTVTMPGNLTSLGTGVFCFCFALEEIIFTGDAPELPAVLFGNGYTPETVVALYPANNATWTEDIMASTDIAIWKPYTLDENGAVVVMDAQEVEETEPEATEEFCVEETEAQEVISETTAVETVPETIPEITEETEPEETESIIEETAATILAVILHPFALRARAAETEPLTETEPAEIAELVETLPAATIPETLPAEETVPVQEDDSLQADAPSHDAVFGGEYSSEEGTTYTMITATFRNLVPGEQYVLLDVLNIEAENPLAPNNLLSINQGVADSKGELVFRYAQRIDSDQSSIVACGASNRNLKDAFIRFPTMLENESFENINPTVDYYGEILKENYDYVLLGDVTYTEAGTYTCFIRGINQYTGLVEYQYTVVPDTLPTISIVGDNVLSAGKSTQLKAVFRPEALPGTQLTWSLAEGDEAYVTLEPDWGNYATVTALETTEDRTVTITASAPGDAHPGQLQVHISAALPEKLTVCREGYDDEGYLTWIPLGDTAQFGYSPEKDSLALAALGMPGDKKVNVTWESSDESIAIIDTQLGMVQFTGTYGTVTFKASYNDELQAEVTFQVTEYVPEETEPTEEPTEPEETTAPTEPDEPTDPTEPDEPTDPTEPPEVQLLAGKAITLKVLDEKTGKALPSSKLRWSLEADGQDPAAFATISTSGRLTAKKLVARADFLVHADVYEKDTFLRRVSFTAAVYPAVTMVEIFDDGILSNGKTVPFDLETTAEKEISVQMYPDDVMDAPVKWTISDKKNNYADYTIDGSTVRITNPKGKTGTVTFKAESTDGSRKSATLKVQFASFAQSVTITSEETILTAGEKMQLEAFTTPVKPTKAGITWTLADPLDKAYVTLTAAGKLTAKNVQAPVDVKILATSKDTMASESKIVHIQPKAAAQLVLKSGEDYVTKTTQTLDVNTQEAIRLEAYTYGETQTTAVTWSPLSHKSANITENEDGSLTVQMIAPGTITVNAKADDGRKASVTIKGVKLASSLEISQKKTGITEGLEVASGKSLDLQATVENAAGKKVNWSIETGSAYAKISASGKVTAAKDLTRSQEITVKAVAADGSGAEDTMVIRVRPIAQGVQVYSEDDGRTLFSFRSQKLWVRGNTNLTWDLSVQPQFVAMQTRVYPFYSGDSARNAIQTVTWKSSAPKIANIVDGHLEIYKTGSTTITVTAADGSNQKVSFKLTVVKTATELSIPDQAIQGGKTLNLAKLLTFTPGDVTNKKVRWEIVEGADYASVSATGSLKTKRVTQPQTITVSVTALDGSKTTGTCRITVTP